MARPSWYGVIGSLQPRIRLTRGNRRAGFNEKTPETQTSSGIVPCRFESGRPHQDSAYPFLRNESRKFLELSLDAGAVSVAQFAVAGCDRPSQSFKTAGNCLLCIVLCK